MKKSILIGIEVVLFVGLFIVGSFEDYPILQKILDKDYYYLQLVFEELKPLNPEVVINDRATIDVLKEQFGYTKTLTSIHIGDKPGDIQTSTNTFDIPKYNIRATPSEDILTNSDALAEKIQENRRDRKTFPLVFFFVGFGLLLIKLFWKEKCYTHKT